MESVKLNLGKRNIARKEPYFSPVCKLAVGVCVNQIPKRTKIVSLSIHQLKSHGSEIKKAKTQNP